MSTRSSAGGRDIFVSELNTNGNFVWAGSMGGPGSDQGQSIAVDGLGDIYTTGLYRDTANFNPAGAPVENLTSISTDREIFVSKLVQTSPFLATAAVALGGTAATQGTAASEPPAMSTSADPLLGNALQSPAPADSFVGGLTATNIGAPSPPSLFSVLWNGSREEIALALSLAEHQLAATLGLSDQILADAGAGLHNEPFLT